MRRHKREYLLDDESYNYYSPLVTGENLEKFPISDLTVSNSEALDEDFEKYGFVKIDKGSYLNMNSIMYCKGCKINRIITSICLKHDVKQEDNSMKHDYHKECMTEHPIDDASLRPNQKRKEIRITYDFSIFYRKILYS